MHKTQLSLVSIWSSDRPDRLKSKRRGLVSDVSGWHNIILARVLQTSPNMMMIFIRRANLAPCYVLFLSILRRRKVRRVPRWRRITSGSWCHLLSPVSNSAHTPGANIFVLFFFFDFSTIQAEFILDYWNKSDDFWDSLRSFRSSQSSENVSIWSLQNLHDRPNGTQLYPSDRGRLSRPGSLPSSG